MFTFFETRLDKYMPSALIVYHNLEFGFEINESIAHLTNEWNFGFVWLIEFKIVWRDEDMI